MKKLIATLFIAATFTSCKLPVYTIGMTEAQFKAQTKFADLYEATADHTIYRSFDHWDDKNQSVYKFYYFVNGNLVRIDEDERHGK